MNLFTATRGGLDAELLAVGQALTDVAAIGLLHERAIRQRDLLTQQLQTTLNNRWTIEQAKGILAQRGGITVDEAFDLLRSYAHSRNLKLTDVADAVVRYDPAVADLVPRAGGSPNPRASSRPGSEPGSSADSELSAIAAPRPEWRMLAPIDCPDARPADVRKDQSPHAGTARDRCHVTYTCMSADTTSEANRLVPPGRIGEHQVHASRPLGKGPEFRRPGRALVRRFDEIPVGRMSCVPYR
jgi:ANTAR domain